MPSAKVTSIQAKRKRGYKSPQAKLQEETMRGAFRNGMPWDDDEVARIVAGIERDETTFEMAMALGRTYYSMTTTRRMVGFAMRHASVIYGSAHK